MTGPAGDATGDLTRTATVETTHADADAAATIAVAISPDNTDDIRTEADGATVVTRVSRETTGGFLASVDDYLVNLDVADDVVSAGRGPDSDADDTTGADEVRDANDADGLRDADDTRGTAGTAETAAAADAADTADTHDT